jgi:signal transduction histidine kinase
MTSDKLDRATHSVRPSNGKEVHAGHSPAWPDLQPDKYRRLYDLIVRLADTDTLEAALDEILRTAIELVEADGGSIRLFEPGNDLFPFVAYSGLPESYIQYFGSLVEPVNPAAREAAKRGKRIIVEDMFNHPPFQPHMAYIKLAGHTSMFGVPLMAHGAVCIGGICTTFIERHSLSEDEFETLELYARLAADTIEKYDHAKQQARVEQELRQALAVKDEFLGLVSHELRTPMTVLRGLASVLNRHVEVPKETLWEVYRDLDKESERLYRLIENMLAVARVEAGRNPATEVILVDKVLDSCAHALRRDMPELTLDVNVDEPGLMIAGIEAHIDQILHNLVQNSEKYSPKGSPVSITAARADDMVRISVADRGVGVKDPVTIFLPFERGDGAERRAPGLGLGLTVCKTLVEAQGGRIWAEHRDCGGTIFSFTLPLYQYLAADLPTSPASSQPAPA